MARFGPNMSNELVYVPWNQDISLEGVRKNYDDWATSYDQLQKIGFTNMDAVDCSQKMLDEAKAKNIYGRLICDFVGPDQLDIQNGMIRYG
ncbi:uncharacterized protein [Branchiostoma lanceolatum]|uniref:uncharacterized protein isoform X3 n=1 Tax=Branchiostoma lanceolatum TaxID=7740 RepID=UPI0034567440